MADTLTARERAEIEAANASGARPVVFIHGLWLHASSWERWADLFRDAGYFPLTPGWPGEPENVRSAREHPEQVASTGIAEATAHIAKLIVQLHRPPFLIGHAFGGLIAQKLLTQNLGAGAVAIDAAAFRGVLKFPASQLKAAFPVLRSPANRKRAVSLSADEFRYGFTNAVSPLEAAELYERCAVPAPGRPLFQAVAANFDPRSELSVDLRNPTRGPLLLVSGEKDHTVPASVVVSEFDHYRKRSPAITELERIPGRGHSLTIDSGWLDVAHSALAFARRFVN
jgi:pimeloyl-ACP methyl ester carboxylesterase